MQRVGGHRPPLQALANEADRSNILAPGLRSETFRTHLFPAFTAGLPWYSLWRQPCRLHRAEPQATRLPLQGLSNDWLVGNRIQLQQRNCPGFTPDFSRRSTDSNSQRTAVRNSEMAASTQENFGRDSEPRHTTR